ncbi:alpha/beta fold hydrolase [Nocardia rhizosphaerihabitans]|uniref:alpha/beta fold hydrolase n=1 Tax=Nocardia rhizosphaerihabitans TaxID=1691570 RepID=UPI003672A9AF
MHHLQEKACELMTRLPTIQHRRIEVDGVDVFYRVSVPSRAGVPTLLLLHGFPSSSHQFRRLIDTLGDRFRLIAPDYPGFGNTVAPADFEYTFDRLAEITEGFADRLGLTEFALYVFDFGAPIGFRMAVRHPERITGLVVQNGNAYEAGLSDGAREFIALRPDQDGAEQAIRQLLTLEGTRGQYETGVADPGLLAPDSWTLDQHYLELPGRKQAQLALAFDYHSNVARYPEWQSWLREFAPPTLITWGANDPFFPAPGAEAYLADLPGAELHLFDTGHFALETHLGEIAPLIAAFLDRLPVHAR